MKTSDLERVIRDYIRELYDMEYKGSLEVTELDPVGYCIKLGMDTPDKPVLICVELEGDALLKYLRQELINRRLGQVYYGKLELVQPCPARTACDDKGRAYRENR